jgi:hypothetical protein
MDNHLPTETVRVLTLVVRMIPVSTCRVGDKLIGIGIAWLDRASCNICRAVVDASALLKHAMEME